MDEQSMMKATNQENSYRFQADRRCYGGMLQLLGFCAIIQPLGNIVSAFGPDGAINTDAGEIPFWGMIGAFCLFINGITAVFTGYMACVHDFSHRYITTFSMVIIQTAFIPYITDMSNVGNGAQLSAEENNFIPLAYEPSDNDVKFVGAMGIMTILTYGFAFVGSISFMVFCLHAYNTGKVEERSGSYFEGRLGFYSGTLALGGLVQLMLGAFCRVNFGLSVLEAGPVRAAMLTVTYPTISIVVGFVQVLNGVWGIARSVGYHRGPNDYIFQISLAVQWLVVLTAQCVAQIGYLPGGMLAAAAPTFAAISLGINLMPAFLDHKMRNLPRSFSADYYTVDAGLSTDLDDNTSKGSDIRASKKAANMFEFNSEEFEEEIDV